MGSGPEFRLISSCESQGASAQPQELVESMVPSVVKDSPWHVGWLSGGSDF